MHDLSLELVWVVGRFREGEVQHTAEKLKVVKLKRPAAKIGRLISEPSLIAESGDRKLFMVDFWESRAIRYRLYSGCVETCPDTQRSERATVCKKSRPHRTADGGIANQRLMHYALLAAKPFFLAG